MKKYVMEFCRRGLIACGFGPLVLAGVYLIVSLHGGAETLSVHQVCVGIYSISALAFVAGGMNVVYQIERLPMMAAIALHGGALYVSYLLVYLINGWLERSVETVLGFSAIFFVGYLIIWAIIYLMIRRSTDRLNEKWQQRKNPPV